MHARDPEASHSERRDTTRKIAISTGRQAPLVPAAAAGTGACALGFELVTCGLARNLLYHPTYTAHVST